MSQESIYAQPRLVTELGDCYFYHTMEIPGYGPVEGEWDLRGRENEYLGGVDFRRKRVLEIGTANGFLCFHMERKGAEVVVYDLSENQSWDVVPYARYDHTLFALERKAHIRRVTNGFWLCHRVFQSKAKMVYGTVYNVPEEIGMVDISTLCAVLLHVRDPFLALQNALRLTRETVIITDQTGASNEPRMQFRPDYERCEPKETWWDLSPALIQRFIGVLGFEDSKVTSHTHTSRFGECRFSTIVGRRTRNAPSA